MNELFKTSSNFQSLSLMDLIDARDANHYLFISKKNVIATAIGLYRIRKTDPWPTKEHPIEEKSKKQKPRRTLFNSEVRPYSWPCIYVFVSTWENENELIEDNSSDVVPKMVSFDKGRVNVPVCIIEAKKQDYSEDLKVKQNSIYPRNFFGPGNPIINQNSQGIQRIATAGCVVKDSERYYILTNKHALGETGNQIHSIKGYISKEIGKTSKYGISRKEVKEVYPHFKSEFQYLQMDIGLIEIDNITEWKTEIAGIKEIENVLDLYDNNFTLQLIGCKVVGLSAITGNLRGEIQGLFYRYKAIGGYEYLSDFLIGPESSGSNSELINEEQSTNIGFNIHHGDSGTLLLIEFNTSLDSKIKLYKYFPFALLWGKHEFIDGKSRKVQPYALATSLGTAINILNLDFVRDINLDNDFIWGYVGHYLIGSKLEFSIDLLGSHKLKKFIKKNTNLLSLPDDNIIGNDPKVLVKDEDGNYNIDSPNFVALADVPDNVWKSNVNFYQIINSDGKPRRIGGPGSRGDFDNANHFADIDLPFGNEKTFLEFNLKDIANNLKPEVWLKFYDSLKPKIKEWGSLIGKDNTGPEYKHWGSLPFRVQQIFNEMVKSIKDGNEEKFLCAGGVLIHYVGDSCQPLHTSYLSQGDPEDVIDKPRSIGKKLRADGVHGGYEDDMINYGYQEKNITEALEQEISRQGNDANEEIEEISNGLEAAKSILLLAKATQETIQPREIIDKWSELAGSPRKDKSKEMWDTFGEKTIICMARGCRYLAKLWQAAWNKGNGDVTIKEGHEISPDNIMKLYNDINFLKSNRLNNYDLGE